MFQIPRLLVAARVVTARCRSGSGNSSSSSNSFWSTAVRHFSHRPGQPPIQEEEPPPRRRFSLPFVENPRLRTHAVSIFSGDYSDDDPEDLFDYEDDMDGIDPDKAEYAKYIQDLDADKKLQDAKWNAKPAPHPTVIDELGRSYGRGGRKTASARVFIQPGPGQVMVNRMPLVQYFIRESHRNTVLEPFVATATCGLFDVQVTVAGGGLSGQAGAARHGVARALNAYHSELYRPALKRLGFLTRDPRKVERKKVGLKKARKAPQWVKR
jgi:small subunit ribosomal protein S9